MSDLLPVQRDLARLLFSLPEAAGYALAGGAALVVQQIVDRDTRDLDAFIAATPGPTPGTVDLLADAFTEAAQRAGWTLQTIRRHPTFCRFILDRDNDTVELDLAVDSPLLEPPTAIVSAIAEAFERIDASLTTDTRSAPPTQRPLAATS